MNINYQVITYGFGVSHFRSINEEQRLGPLQQVTVLAGKNNVGKSNFLRFATEFLHIGEKLEWANQEHNKPQGDNLANPRFSLAASTTDSGFREWLIGDRPGTRINEPLADEIIGRLTDVTGGLVWRKWVPGDARSGRSKPVDEGIDKITESINGVNATSRRQIASAINTQNLSKSLLAGLHQQSRRPAREAVFVNAFREIKSGNGDPWDGTGLVPILADLQNPSLEGGVDERNRKKKRWADFCSFACDVLERPEAVIEIPTRDTTNTKIIVEMDGRTLTLDDLGTGVHEVIILGATATAHERTLICLEEPEIHLHPGLQRKLVEFLKLRTTNQYLIASHSAQLLDTSDSAAFRVRLEDGWSISEAAWSNRNHMAALDDLGYQPTDLLQANAIIWVEGPSDRIYLSHWLRLIDADLIEGVDYSVVFYGGKLLSHTSGSDTEFGLGEKSELLELRRISRRSAIIMDSDRTQKSARINQTKTRLRKEFEQDGVAWVTHGREIENYVPRDLMLKAVKSLDPSATKLAQQKDIPYDQRWRYHRGKGAARKADKVKLARAVTQLQTELPDDVNLRRELGRLASLIRRK